MSERSSRRRLRLRRRRKDAGLGPKLADTRDVARRSDGSLASDAAEEVVYQTGCCLLEAVVSAALLVGLLSVPATLLLNRVT